MEKNTELLDEDKFTVSGTVKKEEFNKYGLYHLKKFHRILFYFLLIFTFLIFAIPTINTIDADLYIYMYIFLFIPYAIISLIVSLPALFLGKFSSKIKTSREYDSDQLIQKEITYTFSSKEIQQKFDRSVGYFEWNQIQNVYENKDMFRLYVSKAKAIILPKRFFNSDAEIDLLKKLIRDNVDNKKVKLM
ncbi:YcxB family protein [Jeotgalibacillus sp. ET6]|uniref:YcxB family protein n=1 Tax=Jeotgalibacillus sp. ET6 TaxID=3037260 RepID=UPI0024186560|nr:YcxB family protein [Jeotgalibacillus sp. ET6]MDG5471448.1 YcxB family protein [Jeotgalibacillus sp. ET6]